MPSVEMLALLYALGGVAVWTWVLRDHHSRARRRVGSRRWLRRRRRVAAAGVAACAAVTLTATTAGLVPGRDAALVLGLVVLGVQGFAAIGFAGRRLRAVPPA